MSVLSQEQKEHAAELMANKKTEETCLFLLKCVSKDDFTAQQKEYFEFGFFQGIISGFEVMDYYFQMIKAKKVNGAEL